MKRNHTKITLTKLGIVCFLATILLLGCSSKLKEEYDFRPYIAAWAGNNCGAKKKYNCQLDDFASMSWDGDDMVYGVKYTTSDSKKRVVFVKVAAVKPYERTIVGDEGVEEDEKSQ